MEYIESQGLESIISWVLNGRGFIVHDPDRLVGILPLFFSQTKYRSFRRQLNMWHFERIEKGPSKGAFMHPYFVRGNKELCSLMSRHISLKPLRRENSFGSSSSNGTTKGRDATESSQNLTFQTDSKNMSEIERFSTSLGITLDMLEPKPILTARPKQMTDNTAADFINSSMFELGEAFVEQSRQSCLNNDRAVPSFIQSQLNFDSTAATLLSTAQELDPLDITFDDFDTGFVDIVDNEVFSS